MTALSKNQLNRLYELRTAARLTQTQLATRVGTTAAQISKLEKGQVSLTVAWMNRLAGPLGCRPVDLMFDAPPPARHINKELLRYAIGVAAAVLEGEPLRERPIILVETIAAAYDVMTEILRERGQIDEDTIDTLIRAHRRINRE
jgi:transcriptional regulator with XRE-family HTH domain